MLKLKVYGMHSFLPILADTATRTKYEWSRLQSFTEWWQKPLLVVICLVVVGFVVYMYRRDSVELRRGVGALLALLRIAAFGGLLVNYLDLQKRTEKLVVQNSQVAMLVDTSVSMSRADGEGSAVPQSPIRIDQVTETLAKGDLIRGLRKTHDVQVYRFDQDLVRVATFPKIDTESGEPLDSPGDTVTATAGGPVASIDWKTVLTPRGTESRYGQSLRQIVNDLRGSPLAGVVMIGDFAENAGLKSEVAVQSAIDAKVPVYTVAVGANRMPVNVGIVDFKAPGRAYPGDKFQVEALIQAKELIGRSVNVELVESEPGTANANSGVVVDSRSLVLGGNNEINQIDFELPGIKEVGRRTMTLRLKGIREDNNPTDNQSSVDVEIVERKNTVLLFAGGPTREYQFLRNQLKRDRDAVVDVYLQTSLGGISQDARKILDDFPATLQELAEYDTIVAFDPDWRELSVAQVQALDDWLNKESGGLLAVAGPVYMDQWIQDKNLGKIRSIYPVEFNTRLLSIDDSRYGSTVAWPIEFTREGKDAEFLWLGTSREQSESAWSSFDGVFGFYQVKGAKPGAVVYGRYGDPDASVSAEKPVYFAEQFWGSGRVFYMGSGEMWRLRSMGEDHFEQFYTKLLRHISQGRLLRGSRLGNLLLERDRYTQGSTIVVRAQLSNSQLQPLTVPEVSLLIARPDFTTQSIKLLADKSRPGMYSGQFPVLMPGGYQLELAVPDAPGEAPLTKRLTVTAPQLEIEDPRRRDELASQVAKRTSGEFYIGMDQALGIGGFRSVVSRLKDRDQTRTTYQTGARDPEWDRRWMMTLLFFIVGVLSLEWVIRRLFRLA
jgi:hypothetical protein